MGLTIKRKNTRSFVSLSALGAGVMALTSGSAKADVIHVIANQKVGFDSGFPSGFSLVIDGAPRFHFQASAKAVETGFQWQVAVNGYCSLGVCPQIPAQHSVLQVGRLVRAFGSGQEWPAAPVFGRFIAVRFRSTLFPGGTISGLATNLDSTFKYFLFRFPDNGNTLYGWGQLSVAGDKHTGPDVTLIDYAYDTTGAFIPAGDTSAPTPEPSPAIPVALGALVLGASAVRRWRAAKTA